MEKYINRFGEEVREYVDGRLLDSSDNVLTISFDLFDGKTDVNGKVYFTNKYLYSYDIFSETNELVMHDVFLKPFRGLNSNESDVANTIIRTNEYKGLYDFIRRNTEEYVFLLSLVSNKNKFDLKLSAVYDKETGLLDSEILNSLNEDLPIMSKDLAHMVLEKNKRNGKITVTETRNYRKWKLFIDDEFKIEDVINRVVFRDDYETVIHEEIKNERLTNLVKQIRKYFNLKVANIAEVCNNMYKMDEEEKRNYFSREMNRLGYPFLIKFYKVDDVNYFADEIIDYYKENPKLLCKLCELENIL